MNRHEFRQALKHHGVSVEEFAVFIGRRTDTVYRYGESQPVPLAARNVLAMLDLGGSAKLLRHISHCRVIRENPLISSENP